MKTIAILMLAAVMWGCGPDNTHTNSACTSTNGHQFSKWEGAYMNDFGFIIQTRTCTNCGMAQSEAHR